MGLPENLRFFVNTTPETNMTQNPSMLGKQWFTHLTGIHEQQIDVSNRIQKSLFSPPHTTDSSVPKTINITI